MWIHLLTLELIDGAGGSPIPPTPIPTPIPGSGGGHEDYRAQMEALAYWQRRRNEIREERVQAIEDARRATEQARLAHLDAERLTRAKLKTRKERLQRSELEAEAKSLAKQAAMFNTLLLELGMAFEEAERRVQDLLAYRLGYLQRAMLLLLTEM